MAAFRTSPFVTWDDYGDYCDPWALSVYGPPSWGNHESRITRYVRDYAWRVQVRDAVQQALGLPGVPEFPRSP